ncbi:hypothetical protein F442_00123 [Phytophthora nicotianae P10297]|uniref:Uncharacterized protein n=1 Tax=Phytophthora nicotianae P10297 TaxID=1317064 RepID=W3A836_PHYNI|nr:hypothetical protein F442_00123 [Phytophthora nicotianae P10297]
MALACSVEASHRRTGSCAATSNAYVRLIGACQPVADRVGSNGGAAAPLARSNVQQRRLRGPSRHSHT